MPIVAVGADRLNQLLGGTARSMEALVEALENLGCDVEDTAEEVHFQCPVCHFITARLTHEAPPRRCDNCDVEQPIPLPEVGRLSVIRLDLLADRPDIFDVGGITRALKGPLGLERGRVVTRDELLQKVWGRRETHRDRTVDVCVRKLRQKIDQRAREHTFIQTRYGVGYKLDAVPK